MVKGCLQVLNGFVLVFDLALVLLDVLACFLYFHLRSVFVSQVAIHLVIYICVCFLKLPLQALNLHLKLMVLVGLSCDLIMAPVDLFLSSVVLITELEVALLESCDHVGRAKTVLEGVLFDRCSWLDLLLELQLVSSSSELPLVTELGIFCLADNRLLQSISGSS